MQINTTTPDAAVLDEFGRRLARHRLNRNLTQAALAREAGVSLRTLHRVEHGEPAQAVQWIRLLRALGLLENFDALVPAPVASPLQQTERRGRERRRASSAAAPPGGRKPWTWEDGE